MTASFTTHLKLGRRTSWLSLLLLLAASGQLLGQLVEATRAPEHLPHVGPGLGAESAASSHDAGPPAAAPTPLRLTSGVTGPAAGPSPAKAAHTARQQQQHIQQLPHDLRGGDAGSATRRLHQIGPIYADMPGDLLGLESILAAARDAFGYFEPGLLQLDQQQPPQARAPRQQQQHQQQYAPRSRALGVVDSSRASRGLVISFQSTHPDVEVRLPGPPRSFNITVRPYGNPGAAQGCSFSRLPYADQELDCQGLTAGSHWEATLVDADSDDLVLATANFTVSGSTVSIPVQLGLVSVETSFDRLAWAGMYYPRPRHATSTIIIHAIIVGAQVVIYTRQGGQEVVWDTQWTGSEGTAAFFLVPGVRNVYWANMSVGETVLRTTPITPEQPLSVYQDTEPTLDGESLPQVQQQQLTAVPQLLCTGEVEDVRGDAGTFPQSLVPLEAAGQIYHPRGFTCRWELTPDQPDVLLSVDYRGLLPDESITLELAPNNIIRLNSPDGGPGAVFQASVWVESSILVSFQTTRLTTERVGAFSISWTSVASGRSNGVLDSKTMVVVLSCVSAAGALLAACCFYFVCCGRRRRAGGVVVDSGPGGTSGVALVRVPSAVRELLPSKPYQAPEANPLPGAETEPDCCSICLVELEAGELVTVLPCMHFYHKDCIGSWLKRNCTCPLCKNNVLEAFKVQQYEARQARRNRRRGIAPAPAAAAAAALEAGSSDGSNTPTSSSSGGGGSSSSHAQQQQHIQMTTLQPSGGAATVVSPAAGWGGSRATSPLPALDAHAAASAAPAGARPLRLPPLQQQQQPEAAHVASQAGSWLHSPQAAASLQPASAPAAPAVAVPQLVIPLSPSMASISSLQSGTVLATPEDFAPAAAAAAAHLADAAPQQRSTSPIADAAAAAAQASVAALRSSSRNLGRRLHVLLSPSSAAAAAGAGSSPAAGTAAGLPSSRVGSPLPQLPAGPLAGAGAHRVAVSIYAYAGHPGTDDETGHQEQQQQGVMELGAGSPHQAITVLGLPGAVEGSRTSG